MFWCHGLINYTDTKAKFHLKKFTCEETLRQMFVRVYKLEIRVQAVMHDIFDPAL
jgi:hypothetical protein